MKRPSPMFEFLQGTLGTALPEPRRMSVDTLLTKAGITRRQLAYYIRNGAVSPPVGRTRSAGYTVDHLNQIRRVVSLLKQGMTVAQVAEAYADVEGSWEKRKRTTAPVQPRKARRATIYLVSPGIRVVADEDLLPSETPILKRLLKIGALTKQEGQRMIVEGARRDYPSPAGTGSTARKA